VRRAHRFDVQVRFGDTDALGHVNNASYAAWTEAARLDFLLALEREAPSALGHPARADAAPGPGLILARIAIDFRRQVRFGEPVAVLTDVLRAGTRSFTLRQRIEAAGEPAAEATTVLVVFDYAAQRSAELPPALRAALAPWMAADAAG
jgi:acyl-CoA thioester hydrolase